MAKKEGNNDGKSFDFLSKAASLLISTIDRNYAPTNELRKKESLFQSIVDEEIDLANGISGGSIIDWVANKKTENYKQSNPDQFKGIKDPYELFANNSTELFNTFKDNYKNKYVEVQDLKFISKFIPALGEAVNTTLTYISSADEIHDSILRNIVYGKSASDDQIQQLNEYVERIEKEHDLRKKLKNHIYRNAIISGTTYVYAVSYEKLFGEYSTVREKQKKTKEKFGSVTESFTFATLQDSIATECFSSDDMATIANNISGRVSDATSPTNVNDMANFKKSVVSLSQDFKFIDSDVPFPVLEQMNSDQSFKAFAKKAKSEKNTGGAEFFSESVADIPDEKSGSKSYKAESFEKTSGTYFKVLNYKKILPLKIFDETVGYYYIHTNKKVETANKNSQLGTLLDGLNVNNKKKQDTIGNLVDSISDMIIKNFSSKFVVENDEFKKSIADCIVMNGFTNSEYKIQFIPVEDVIEFKVNEDEEGNGQSILINSLFPAKMLLSLIISKMLYYMNKTGNRTIIHTYKNTIDEDQSNHVQRVIRNLQESDINFNDVLNPTMLYNKVGRNGTIHVPTSRDGKRLVEFETQEGQQIDMSTEYESKLENMTILGSGVPSVIIEYSSSNSPEFAKQITTANIKYANSIGGMQADLEIPTTVLYKKLLLNSDMPDELKAFVNDSFAVTLPRPTVLSNQNKLEFLNNAVDMATRQADVLYGMETDDNRIKRNIYIRRITLKNTKFMDWEQSAEEKVDLAVEVQKEKKLNPEEVPV